MLKVETIFLFIRLIRAINSSGVLLPTVVHFTFDISYLCRQNSIYGKDLTVNCRTLLLLSIGNRNCVNVGNTPTSSHNYFNCVLYHEPHLCVVEHMRMKSSFNCFGSSKIGEDRRTSHTVWPFRISSWKVDAPVNAKKHWVLNI